MIRLLSATALCAITTGSAFADGHTGSPFADIQLQDGQTYLATDLIGQRVYAAEQEFELDTRVAAGTQTEWDDVGEIGDVVLTVDGKLAAVIVDIGGFLGIGEREVALQWNAIRPVVEDDDPNDVFLVINATAETLEAAPELRRADAEARPVRATDRAEVRMDGDRPMLRTPPTEREGYELVVRDELTADDMTGMRVYGSNDEDVGEISELIMSSDGATIERAVLDIGGFLGIGEHEVAVTLDELQIMRDANGTNRVYIDATQEELEAQPAYAR